MRKSTVVEVVGMGEEVAALWTWMWTWTRREDCRLGVFVLCELFLTWNVLRPVVGS